MRNRRWNPRHLAPRSTTRHAVAVEAARLLYRREFKEYFQAKREAARRQNTTVLPTNREIHDQLLLIADQTEGKERTRRLGAMRRRALQLMELLEEFEPRVIGSTWTGHIRKGSDIDLHLFFDDLGAVTHRLDQNGLAYQVEVVHSRKFDKEMEFVHLKLLAEEPCAVEMTVYPRQWLKVHPKCSITGGPMARGTISELRTLIALEHGQCLPQTTRKPTALAERLAKSPAPGWLDELLPELVACRGVEQNLDHHLDVYDHTWAAVREAAKDQSELHPDLSAHLAEPGPAGWPKSAILNLAVLCHDLGKPSCLSRDRRGRIRFFGHEQVGEEMVHDVGARLELPSSVTAAVAQLVALHMEPVLIPTGNAEPSRLYRLFQAAQELLPELMLLSLADLAAARGPEQPIHRLEEQKEFVREMLEQYFEGGFLRFPTPPISAIDLAEELGLEEGKVRQALLERLTEAYVDGEFVGREDGLMWAADLLESPFQEWRR